MVLNAEQRQIPVAHALEGCVVQVNVRELDFRGGQRVRVDGEVVIMRRNLDLAGGHLFNGMIAAMMPKFEFVGLAPES